MLIGPLFVHWTEDGSLKIDLRLPLNPGRRRPRRIGGHDQMPPQWGFRAVLGRDRQGAEKFLWPRVTWKVAQNVLTIVSIVVLQIEGGRPLMMSIDGSHGWEGTVSGLRNPTAG